MEKNLDAFIDLSVQTTGISKDILAPTVTNFDLPPFYYDQTKTKYGESFEEMLIEFEKNGLNYVLTTSPYDEMVQQIMFLWYMGAWAVDVDQIPGAQTRIINSISYQKGMVWQVMQSHPMGYSVSRYGYWGHQPADLNAYIGQEKGWN